MSIIELLLEPPHLLCYPSPYLPDRHDEQDNRDDEKVDLGLLPETASLAQGLRQGLDGGTDVNVEERQGQDAMIAVDELHHCDVSDRESVGEQGVRHHERAPQHEMDVAAVLSNGMVHHVELLVPYHFDVDHISKGMPT